MCVCVCLHLNLVVANHLLPAESAQRLLLGRFDGKTIGFDGCASASGIGLLVLARDAVFLGDRHS